MYKIVAIDLDDTLLNKDKQISEENKKTLAKCQELGVKIVISTGRPYIGIQKVLNELNLVGTDTYAFCYNGGLIYSLKNMEIIASFTITGRDIKKLYQESLRLNTYYHLYDLEGKLYTPKMNEYTMYGAKLVGTTANIVEINSFPDDKLFLKGMLVDDKNHISEIISQIDPQLKEQYANFLSAPIYYEFLNPKATKGSALKYLANHLNIDIKDTIAIGDSENDLSMIIDAGLGVAMENSYPHIKEKADFITKDCNEDGVSYVLKKFILDR